MLSNVLYIAGVMLVLMAILAVVGLVQFPWVTLLVVGIVCVVAAYIIGRGPRALL